MAYRQTPATLTRKQEARVNIRLAAQACVAAYGFSDTQMTGIARRAGVATGTLYNHFPSKAELFTEVFRRVADHELALAHLTVAGDGTIGERLENSLSEWCRRAIASGSLAYALLVEPVDIAVAEERLKFRRAYTRLYAELIDEGIAAGEFPAQNSEVSAAGLIGAMAEILVRPLAQDTIKEAEKIDAMIRDILRFCIGAILHQVPTVTVRNVSGETV